VKGGGSSPERRKDEGVFVLSNFLLACAQGLNAILTIYSWISIVRALISWVSPDPFNPIVRFLVQTTEPVLDPIRRRLPVMPIDLSPVIVLLFLMFLRSFLVRTLLEIAVQVR